MTHVICRLTAKNRDQLRIPTIGNRARATLPFIFHQNSCKAKDKELAESNFARGSVLSPGESRWVYTLLASHLPDWDFSMFAYHQQ